MNLLSPFTSTNFVLTFHKVVSKQWFADVMQTISRSYNFISSEEIEKYYYSNKHFNNCCHICFDDGDKSFYDQAFGVLKQMNIPATIFVSPQIINNNSNYWFQDIEYILSQSNEISIRQAIAEVTGWPRTQ